MSGKPAKPVKLVKPPPTLNPPEPQLELPPIKKTDKPPFSDTESDGEGGRRRRTRKHRKTRKTLRRKSRKSRY